MIDVNIVTALAMRKVGKTHPVISRVKYVVSLFTTVLISDDSVPKIVGLNLDGQNAIQISGALSHVNGVVKNLKVGSIVRTVFVLCNALLNLLRNNQSLTIVSRKST